jgi:hypothetical protein
MKLTFGSLEPPLRTQLHNLGLRGLPRDLLSKWQASADALTMLRTNGVLTPNVARHGEFRLAQQIATKLKELEKL